MVTEHREHFTFAEFGQLGLSADTEELSCQVNGKVNNRANEGKHISNDSRTRLKRGEVRGVAKLRNWRIRPPELRTEEIPFPSTSSVLQVARRLRLDGQLI